SKALLLGLPFKINDFSSIIVSSVDWYVRTEVLYQILVGISEFVQRSFTKLFQLDFVFLTFELALVQFLLHLPKAMPKSFDGSFALFELSGCSGALLFKSVVILFGAFHAVFEVTYGCFDPRKQR